LIDFLGRKLASFLAAASIDSAAPNNSFSAIIVGSSGLTQSLPKHFHIFYNIVLNIKIM